MVVTATGDKAVALSVQKEAEQKGFYITRRIFLR